MIWLLAAIAAAQMTASGTRSASVSVRLVVPPVVTAFAAPPPPAVLVNRTREPFDRYADTENRRALAQRPTNA